MTTQSHSDEPVWQPTPVQLWQADASGGGEGGDAAAGDGETAGAGDGEGASGAAAGGEGASQAPEWLASVQDEKARTALSGFDSLDSLHKAVGYEPPKAETKDWREGLDEDLRKTADRFNSPQDALRAIQALQKREGQVRVPGKDATDEERAAYRKAVGIPDSPDGYEFPEVPKEQITDEVKASRAAWGQRFHENGVPKETAKALIAAVHEDAQKAEAAIAEADQQFAKQQEEALRAEWKGEAYDQNRTLANRAFAQMAERAGLKVEDLGKIETKDGRLLMDRSEIVKMFATVGREMQEGTLGPSLSATEVETIDEQIRDLRSQISDAQSKGDSKRANQLYQREQALIAKKEGRAPVVGAQGRAA